LAGSRKGCLVPGISAKIAASIDTDRKKNHALPNRADRPSLISRRLILRRPQTEDAEAIQRLANDWEVAKRLARLPYPYTLENALFFLDEIASKELVWIAQHSETGELLGVAGLKPLEDAGTLELGYWLGRQFWGRGFGTEAANVVLDYAFGAPSTSAVTAGCFTDNLRSERLLKKLGFHIAKESLRFCLAEGRELPHYDMLLTRKVRDEVVARRAVMLRPARG
jgi:[ribosomal protein S5]-alanine N-acetyltransferase